MTSEHQALKMLDYGTDVLDAAQDLDGALSLVNMSRQGTSTAKMTPQQGADFLKTHKLGINDTADRLRAIVESVYQEKLVEWTNKYDQGPAPATTKTTSKQGPKIAPAKKPTGPSKITPPETSTATRKLTAKSADLNDENAPQPKVNKTTKTASKRPATPAKTEEANNALAQIPEATRPKRKRSAALASLDNENNQAAKVAKTKPAPVSTQNNGMAPVRASTRVKRPSRSIIESQLLLNDRSSTTRVQVEAAAPDTEAEAGTPQPTRRPRIKRTRDASTIKNRGYIEMFGRAIQEVIKQREKPVTAAADRIPDYSAPFSDPAELLVIEHAFKKSQAKYENAKRRCLFGAALIYELNCRTEARRLAAATSRSDSNVSTGESSSSQNSGSNSTRSSQQQQQQQAKKGADALYDLNTTRMQPAGGVDVNTIRPMFRAFREVDDQTFKAMKRGGKTPAESDGEKKCKGVLAHTGWFPKMVGVSDDNGGVEGLVGEWYEKLGSKDERMKWLAIVETEKLRLESIAITPRRVAAAAAAAAAGEDEEDE